MRAQRSAAAGPMRDAGPCSGALWRRTPRPVAGTPLQGLVCACEPPAFINPDKDPNLAPYLERDGCILPRALRDVYYGRVEGNASVAQEYVQAHMAADGECSSGFSTSSFSARIFFSRN